MISRLFLILVFFIVGHASAIVVVTYRGSAPNPLDLVLPKTSPFDINSDGIIDYTFYGTTFYSSFASSGDNQYIGLIDPTGFYTEQVVPIATGSILGADASISYGGWYKGDERGSQIGFVLGYDTSGFMQFADAFIGVQFAAIDGIHYGWIQYTGFSVAKIPVYQQDGSILGYVDGINRHGGFVNSWGYETIPGKSIAAGIIPEPAMPLLVLVSSLVMFRRRVRLMNTF